MKDLFKRSITGIGFLIILISSIMFSYITFFFIFLIIMIIAQLEFYNIAKKSKSHPQVFLSIALSIVIYILNFLYAIDYIHIKILLLIIPATMLVFISELYRYKKRPVNNIANTLLSIIYIGVPISLLPYFVFNLNLLSVDIFNLSGVDIDTVNNITDYFSFLSSSNNEIDYSPNILLGYFVILWCYDSFAYLFGSAIGRMRLSEKISPKKSWEGLIGGTLSAFVAAYVISIYATDLYFTNWLVIAFLIVFMSTIGDLLESLFKRSVDLKDSGKILPGHGGVLDRFDGVLLSAPMVLFYLEIVKFG